MSLRRRLLWLLATFAVFAVAASFVTIYGIRFHVEGAIAQFQHSEDQHGAVVRLRVAGREQVVRLHEVLEGHREPNASYRAARDAFFVTLEEVADHAPVAQELNVEALGALAKELRHEFHNCLDLMEKGRPGEARQRLERRIEDDLMQALDERLRMIRRALDESRGRSLNELASTNTQVLALAAAVGAVGAGLVVVGAALIRRWLMAPIGTLHEAIKRFGEGDFAHRIGLAPDDELGALGAMLNKMRTSLVNAQRALHTSEAKYRSLFENLRDAVIICDDAGRVIEYHDGDIRLLDNATPGRPRRSILETWPHWESGAVDWRAVVGHVLSTGTQYRAAAAVLTCGEDDGETVVDLVAYPVEYGNARYVAVALRDVTGRERLAEQARRTDAMEASVTLARGIAHDFTNLLTSATGTLSLLEPQVDDEKHRERLRAASRSCWHAAGLASRLLNFASADGGYPQVFCLADMVQLILGSLDEALLENIGIERDFDSSVMVKVDQDQLTQVVLNLVRNACEAMPDGGTLRVAVESAETSDPIMNPAGARHAVLRIADGGCGMPPEVRQRLFEPFFTTKARAARRSRGMGLAVVYAAVKNAGGFIHVDSQVGSGTEFRVHLPLGEGAPQPVEPPAYAEPPKAAVGTILLVEDEPSMLEICTEAFLKWGYTVVAAASCADARARYREVGVDTLDLAVIDMHLPDGEGVALARELLAGNPSVRLIFTTGFADLDIPEELESRVSARILKPFRIDQLGQIVSQALATAPQPAARPEPPPEPAADPAAGVT